MDAITLCGGHSVGVFLMERMVYDLGENEWFTSDNDGLLSRKMLTDWKIWFYKNLRKKGVESAWQSVETGV